MAEVLGANAKSAEKEPGREMPSSQRLLEKSCSWTPSAKELENKGPGLLSADQICSQIKYVYSQSVARIRLLMNTC